MKEWTHFDGSGKPVMVNVGSKKATLRRALAEGWLELPEAVYDAVKSGDLRKGDPISAKDRKSVV